MQNKNIKILIEEVREGFKNTIDDMFNIIEILKEDIEKLKSEKNPLE